MADAAAALLHRIERSAPRLADSLKRRFVELGVPANRAMGIRITRIDAGRGEVELRLRPRRRNRNVGGTVHGGVLLAFAETVHGVAVLWRFPPAQHRMVTREARITYLAPARGPLTTRFTLGHTRTAEIATDLDRSGETVQTFRSDVTDRSGTVVARLEADYRIARR